LTDRKNESLLFRTLKWRSKVQSICRWSYKVSCGNEFLCSYANQFNPLVVLNPTTIDTERLHNPTLYAPKAMTEYIVVGWTGSHSTLKYFESVEPVLMEIEHRFKNIKFMIIADRKPALKLDSMIFRPWTPETEIQDLAQFDIGIMPLPDNVWSKGKCGFKALQYMAMGIPTIASPVGVNTKIIDHGVNGFLCNTTNEWINSLEQLAQDNTKRKQLGERGRAKVVSHYSVVSNSANFLSLFQL
jgi:glycosyltransferase involved in cell wall biosynthesis